MEEDGVLLTTREELPGYSIVKFHGIINARYRDALYRDQAYASLVPLAKNLGANAVVGVGYYGVGPSSVAAYGTAVTVASVHDHAKPVATDLKEFPITTCSNVPGYVIFEEHGILNVRKREIMYRDQAHENLIPLAREKGANAVVGVGFYGLGNSSVSAYGTAVTLVKN